MESSAGNRLNIRRRKNFIAGQQMNIIINKIFIEKTLKYLNMCERKIWKEEEDHILKQLYEKNGIKRWSEISRIMEEEHGIEGRNGKQCRERYNNHLKRGINKEQWRQQQQLRLIELHVIHGNRWALFSKLIPGRTQNCVKNMLYSKMRKSVRQLNRFAYQHYRKQLKEIKISFIYRLIEFTQQTYNKDSRRLSSLQLLGLKIKNQILKISIQKEEANLQRDKEAVKNLIEEIHAFKRANQHFRGNPNRHYKQRTKVQIQNTEEASEMNEQAISSMKDSVKEQENEKSYPPRGKTVVFDLSARQLSFLNQNSCKQKELLQKSETNDYQQKNQLSFLVDSVLQKPIQIEMSQYNQLLTPNKNEKHSFQEQHHSMNWTVYFS